jgi:hypothetical protein
MNQAAGQIGELLGKVAARVDSMKQQRAEIAAELDNVISVAQRMKAELGFATGGGTKQRRQMSAEARERIAAAARKRWIAYRKDKAKTAK